MAMGVVEANYKFKYFIFCRPKNTGKMERAQGKLREFDVNWSVATLKFVSQTTMFLTEHYFLLVPNPENPIRDAISGSIS